MKRANVWRGSRLKRLVDDQRLQRQAHQNRARRSMLIAATSSTNEGDDNNEAMVTPRRSLQGRVALYWWRPAENSHASSPMKTNLRDDGGPGD